MKKGEYIIENIDALDSFAEKFVKSLQPKVYILRGELGAGKTAFVKAICKAMKISDSVTSPTFSLINEYSGNPDVIHMDLYRLESEIEALNIGVEEYFYSGKICFVEWPDVAESILPDDYEEIKIEIIDESKRKIIYL